MEYTKSVDRNGEVFETFEGTPEEIARLIRLMERGNMGGNGMKGLSSIKNPSPMVSPNITPNIPNIDGEAINKALARQVSKALKVMKQSL